LKLELWQYNILIRAYEEKRKEKVLDCILIGYYTAYYLNGGKKAKKPRDLANLMFKEKQNLEEGFKQIDLLKKKEGEKYDR